MASNLGARAGAFRNLIVKGAGFKSGLVMGDDLSILFIPSIPFILSHLFHVILATAATEVTISRDMIGESGRLVEI